MLGKFDYKMILHKDQIAQLTSLCYCSKEEKDAFKAAEDEERMT
jgi:hypothetical protein